MSNYPVDSPAVVPKWFFAFIPYKIGEGLYINLLPLFIIQVIGGTVKNVAILNSLVALTGVVGFSLWGNLSDRNGSRRPFLTIGFIGLGTCILLVSQAQNFQEALLYTALGGFLMAAVTPSATALVIDSFPQKDLPGFFSKFYPIGAWCFVAAIIIGAFWLEVASFWGDIVAIRSLLIFSGSAILLSFLLLSIFLAAPKKVTTSKRRFNGNLLKSFPIAILERRITFYPARLIYFTLSPDWLKKIKLNFKSPLTLYYCCSFVLFLAIQIFLTPFPIFLSKILAASNTEILLIVLGKSLVEALFYIPMSRFMRRSNSIKLQAFATVGRILILMTFTLVALAQPNNLSLLIVAIAHILNGLTWSAINVSSTVSVARLAKKGQEAMAIGLYNSIVGMAITIGSLVSGYIALYYGYGVCFGISAVLCSITALCLWLVSAIDEKQYQPNLNSRL